MTQVLSNRDIDFIIKCIDKAPIQGIQASMKLNEVFLKLQDIKNGKEKENDETEEGNAPAGEEGS